MSEVVSKVVESNAYRILNPNANMFSANQFIPTPSGGEAFFSTEVEQNGDNFYMGVYVRDCANKNNCDSTLVGLQTSEDFSIFDEDYAQYADTLEAESKKKSLNLISNFDLNADQKNAYYIATGNPNIATDTTVVNDDDEDGGNGNGDDGTPPPVVDVWKDWKASYDDININIEGRKFRGSKPGTGYGNYYYPEDLSSNKQDRIRFTQKYSEGTTVSVDFSAESKAFQRKVETINGSVTLPIVSGIGDQNAVDWAGKELNPLQALGAAGAVSLFEEVRRNEDIAGGFAKMGDTIRTAGQQILKSGKAGSDMAKAINVYLAQGAVGAQGLLSRTTGAIVNPNLEMLFGGPKLRTFNFTFLLSPRDADEATQVRKILRFFKQGMSVKTSSSNVFLKAPNLFDIQYQTFNSNGDEISHPSINFIKTCALTSCDVQYTPQGTYMTYEDPYRTLTSYQLTLSFGELDPIFDSDYTDLDDDQDQVIGY